MARSQHPLSDLPILEDTWLIGTSRLKAWIQESESALPFQPYLILILSVNTGLICGFEILPEPPTAAQIARVLFKAMKHLPPEVGNTGRPRHIALIEAVFLEQLQERIRKEGLDTGISLVEAPPEFFEPVQALEKELQSHSPDIPAMLQTRNVTRQLLQGVFEAAAAFYRAESWVHLSSEQVLAIRHPDQADYRYAVVMGQGGMEYGITMYTSWKAVQGQFQEGGRAFFQDPSLKYHALTFEHASSLPFADLDLIEMERFEVASERAYPVGMVIDSLGSIQRPARVDWEWYEAALRVIPFIVAGHLHSDEHGDYQPFETTIPVQMQGRLLNIGVKYPAGELSLEDQPVGPLEWPQPEEDQDLLPGFDMRAMEKMMSEQKRALQGEPQQGTSAVERAQQVMYSAWEEQNPARRISLAHQALSISAECADAYVLLAEEEAHSEKLALGLFEKGMQAGERALGKRYFREKTGHFWGLLETRPYMRARQGLARTLAELKRFDEAIQHYRELLRLNPFDNQGNRYELLGLLMQIGRYDDAYDLLLYYKEDWTASWLYSRALLEFRKAGTSAASGKFLKRALEQNPHVPPYLLGEKRVPNEQPDTLILGDESEAVDYVGWHLNHWRRIPGAIDWLRAEIKAELLQKRAGRKRVSSRTGKRGKGKVE